MLVGSPAPRVGIGVGGGRLSSRRLYCKEGSQY